jgi:NADP-dependent 3-hydroxy acid dehydrogenase YdfG
LSEAGATVVLLDRDGAALEAARERDAASAHAAARRGRRGSRSSVRSPRSRKRLAAVDILVNNAGPPIRKAVARPADGRLGRAWLRST